MLRTKFEVYEKIFNKFFFLLFKTTATDRKVLAMHCAQTKSKLVQRNELSSLADRMSSYIRRM